MRQEVFALSTAKQAVSHRFPLETAYFFCPKQAGRRLLCLFRSLGRAVKSPDSLRSLFPLLLQRLLQNHILHLYGVSGLVNPNLSQVVPVIKGFLCCNSQLVTGFPTYSQAKSGKNTVWPGSLSHQLPGHFLMR